MTAEPSRDFIQSLQRGLSVIASFSRERPSQTLSEVAQETGLTRATARRDSSRWLLSAMPPRTGGTTH